MIFNFFLECPEGCSKCGFSEDGENIECYECMVEENNPYYFCDCKEEECLKKRIYCFYFFLFIS